MGHKTQVYQAAGDTYVIGRRIGGGAYSNVHAGVRRGAQGTVCEAAFLIRGQATAAHSSMQGVPAQKTGNKPSTSELACLDAMSRMGLGVRPSAVLRLPNTFIVVEELFATNLETPSMREAFLEGGLLDSCRRVRAFLRDILLQLQTCHADNLVHRDVKLANILYRDSEFALGDFNLSAAALAKRAQGTLRYLSPEELENILNLRDAPICAKSDVYKTAICAYLLLGLHVFEAAQDASELRGMQKAYSTFMQYGVKALDDVLLNKFFDGLSQVKTCDPFLFGLLDKMSAEKVEDRWDSTTCLARLATDCDAGATLAKVLRPLNKLAEQVTTERQTIIEGAKKQLENP